MAGNALEPLRVIGFDVRRSTRSSAAMLLPEERRIGSLMNPDCAQVLSADPTIWPSLFHLEDGSAPWPTSFPDLTPVQIGPESRYFAAFGLWPDFTALRNAYVASPHGDFGIALALLLPQHYQQPFQRDSWFDAIIAPGASPDTPASDWPFLGFDVVNSGLQSALAGFGPLGDIADLRAAWSGDMNEFHLFDSLPRALDFCSDANTRLQSDGPFFIVALFLFWDTMGELAPLARSLQAGSTTQP